jgi:hypothetical protein
MLYDNNDPVGVRKQKIIERESVGENARERVDEEEAGDWNR